MAEPAESLPFEDVKSESESLIRIKDRDTDELVIALCGPVGSPIKRVSERLQDVLQETYGYDVRIIKLSDLIIGHSGLKVSGNRYPERTHKLIDAGDGLRAKYGREVLAELAVSKILLERIEFKKKSSHPNMKSRKICHIIDSVKNEKELELLKEVYRDLLLFIGVYSPVESREAALKAKGCTDEEVQKLIDRDSGEEIAEGQQVRNVFPKVDVFTRVEVDSDSEIDPKISRFLDLVFCTKIHTPTREETAMYLATSAAGNSACLSRQVGACLTDENGEVLSLGWNDVPKSGGDLYTAESSKDNRCWNMEGGICFNDREKKSRVDEIVNMLVETKLVAPEKREDAAKKIADSKIKDLIEFSRSIHAEMHAIILGSQKAGTRVRRGKLFITTFPCHSCARHIVLAGIAEVYYIEPYRKSLALHLHSDAIAETASDATKVKIRLFDGISPKRYLELFSSYADKRKSSGKLSMVKKKDASPMLAPSLVSFVARERLVYAELSRRELVAKEDIEV